MIGVKDVLTAEELVTSVTNGHCPRAEESSVAVDVRNAVFVWPHGRRSDDLHADVAGFIHAPLFVQYYIHRMLLF